MPKYCTVSRYLLADEALPGIQTMSPVTIASAIARAESSIDSYMEFAPLIPNGFAAGVAGMVQQPYDWDARRMRFPLPLVPVRRLLRVQVHVSNTSPGGAAFVATFNGAGDVVLNQYDNYGELVALQGTLYSLAPVLVQLGAKPPLLEIDAELGYYLPSSGEVLTDLGDHQTYQAQRQYWATSYTQASHNQPLTPPPIPPVVYLNGSVVSQSQYTVNATEGQIVFTSPNAASATVTCDYTYTIPDFVAHATIAQTTYLLGQRNLNAAGMQGVEMLRAGEQIIKRHLRGGLGNRSETYLHPQAEQLLAPYKPVAVG